MTDSLTIDEVVEVFRRHLYLPDDTPLVAICGAVAANLLEADPVWLLLVGAPGDGKTEQTQPLTGLPYVHAVGTFTEGALLSGTSKKDRAAHAKGGLLREAGEFGILLCKDFGSVLSMNRDTRNSALAALREIYDGSWVRHVGTDGGQKLEWTGKLGFIGGVTPTIDRHHAVMGVMGERFLLLRLPKVGKDRQTERALRRPGSPKAMRDELVFAVQRLFAGATNRTPVELNDEEVARLTALADFVTTCRSAVERDGYSREIELVPPSEAPTRLALQLRSLLYGLDTLGVQRQRAWRIVQKVALDSMPALRRRVIEALAESGEIKTPEFADILDYPTSTVRRALQDLTAHGAVTRTARGKGSGSDSWALSQWTTDHLAALVPEMSVGGHEALVPEMSVGKSGAPPETPKKAADLRSYTLPSAPTDISGTQSVPPLPLVSENPDPLVSEPEHTRQCSDCGRLTFASDGFCLGCRERKQA